MTPTPCRVAGCIISIRRTYSCAGLLTYLLTYTVGSGHTKPAISPKRLKIKRKLGLLGLLTVYIKSYTGFGLPPKCMTVNDLCARFKVIGCLILSPKWRNTGYSIVMNDYDATQSACRPARGRGVATGGIYGYLYPPPKKNSPSQLFLG